MPSLNSKYTDAFRDQTIKYIIESNKSATGVGEELGVDKNTICRWMRDYRRKNNLPSFKEDKRRIEELEEEVAILKKEWIYFKRYVNLSSVEASVFEYIAVFYNRRRMHSSLGHLSPRLYLENYLKAKAS